MTTRVSEEARSRGSRAIGRVCLLALAAIAGIASAATATERGRWQDRESFWSHDADGFHEPKDPAARFLPGRDPEWRPGPTDWIRIDREARLGFGYGLDLNRVDGLTLLLSQEIENRGWGPSLAFYEGYGLASEDWSGAAEVSFSPGPVELGFRWGEETVGRLLPRQAVTATENALFAFFAREDYRDYFRREARTYFVEWTAGENRGLTLAYHDERHASLERQIRRFGVFGGDASFDPNPTIEEGRWDVLQARAAWKGETGDEIWGPGAAPSLLVDAQWSGGALGDGRVFTRLWAEHRGQLRLSPRQGLSYRLTAGGTPQGGVAADGSRLPLQWQFQAGGIGTLRGHDFQEFRGDRLVLATLEYGMDFGGSVRPVLFMDGGKAWNESQDASGGVAGSGELALDGGIGVLLGSEGLRIDLARDLRRERASARLTVRFVHAL